jgi:phthalate 4,5-dioxygenase oxygenase subunit
MHVNCNWAQVLEGAIDSAHSSSLHATDMVPVSLDDGTAQQEWRRPSVDKAPRLHVERTPWGFRYVAIRHPLENADSHDYLRITLFVAPFTVLIPPNPRYNLSILNIPQDDTHTMFYFIAWSEGPGFPRTNGGSSAARRSASISTANIAASAPRPTTICRTGRR